MRQGPQEQYGEFVVPLQEAAKRLLTESETENEYLKQLAFENANPAYQAAQRPRLRGKSFSDFIRLCADIDPVSTVLAWPSSQPSENMALAYPTNSLVISPKSVLIPNRKNPLRLPFARDIREENIGHLSADPKLIYRNSLYPLKTTRETSPGARLRAPNLM